jgi:hypothetical protein
MYQILTNTIEIYYTFEVFALLGHYATGWQLVTKVSEQSTGSPLKPEMSVIIHL